ncbi:MAG: quinone-dependent dihydroorotate dehydrogenase [Pedosphaera sp.]|nr:quinone-dependent dihydroorotate dehydrogenase [Pedosphaera sp.]
MSFCYRHFVRPVLFTQESEKVHNRTLHALGTVSRSRLLCGVTASIYGAQGLPIELCGLRFPNPVGLAAGMDKQAAAVPVWEALGFGFCELGGVTWHAQPGNPAPRMFRAIPDRALVNRMGFNNGGAEAMARQLTAWRQAGRWPNHPVGINLGKSKITPLEKAAEDYASSFKLLRDHADFFVVNVSSPNTPNLRQLQDKSALDEILAALQEENKSFVVPGLSRTARTTNNEQRATNRKPVLVKVAPDLSFEALDEILELTGPRHIAGIVATNTTISRPNSSHPALGKIYAEAGGLSGAPLRARSTEVIRHLYRQTKGHLPIIGVGGIFDGDSAWEKITAGASLVQIYSGLVYEGPGIVKKIVRNLGEQLRKHGLSQLSEAVGIFSKES